MPDIRIDDMLEDVYRVHAQRARNAGLTLNEYFLEWLARHAEPTVEERLRKATAERGTNPG